MSRLFPFSKLYGRNAAIYQVPVTLEVWPDMIHQWQLFPDRLRQARTALADIAHFTTTCYWTME